MKRHAKTLAAAAVGAALLISGCGGEIGTAGAGASASGQACTSFSSKRPVTVLIVDVSGRPRRCVTAAANSNPTGTWPPATRP